MSNNRDYLILGIDPIKPQKITVLCIAPVFALLAGLTAAFAMESMVNFRQRLAQSAEV